MRAADTGMRKPPAYPFTAQEIYEDLRARLEEEGGEKLTFKRVGQIIGRSKSTAHHWFSTSAQDQFTAWICLMERLSVNARNSFLDTHCRIFPTLGDSRLMHAPSKVGRLEELLRQKQGLTLLCGGTDTMRTFVATAMGHAYRRTSEQLDGPVGIDLHKPSKFVPVESLVYMDSMLAPREIKRLVDQFWPKIQTCSGKLIVLNGVWGRVTEIRDDILRCAKRNHVLVAEAGTPDLLYVRSRVSDPLHLVSLRGAKRISGGICINCVQLKPLKRPKKEVFQ